LQHHQEVEMKTDPADMEKMYEAAAFLMLNS